MHIDRRPLVAVTMGDPSGVGPEICARLLTDPQVLDYSRPVLIGCRAPMLRALEVINKTARVVMIDEPQQAEHEPGTIYLLQPEGITGEEQFPVGEVAAQSGRAGFLCVKKAIELAMDKKVDATVTAPLNKAALSLAGCPYPGHTEMYADLTGTEKYAMMLVHGALRVIHVSTHVSLRKACDAVTRGRVLETIRLADGLIRQSGKEHPLIAVAGLNPHAGENGLFGDEETEHIMPAIADACAEGIAAEGPLPPDSVFAKAAGGLYDAVVAMYHDQGHIPLKMLGFAFGEEKNTVNGINITLGLPIIRVSVDHGTAFDIAGTGKATEDSLRESLEWAVKLAGGKINI